MTFKEFAEQIGLKIETTPLPPENRDRIRFYRYHLKLTRKGSNEIMEVPGYSAGEGIILQWANTREINRGRRSEHPSSRDYWGKLYRPPASDVLQSLHCDVSSADETFESWAAEFGYDEDSRKAEAIWRQCQDEARALRRFLGLALFATFLECEEE